MAPSRPLGLGKSSVFFLVLGSAQSRQYIFGGGSEILSGGKLTLTHSHFTQRTYQCI